MRRCNNLHLCPVVKGSVYQRDSIATTTSAINVKLYTVAIGTSVIATLSQALFLLRWQRLRLSLWFYNKYVLYHCDAIRTYRLLQWHNDKYYFCHRDVITNVTSVTVSLWITSLMSRWPVNIAWNEIEVNTTQMVFQTQWSLRVGQSWYTMAFFHMDQLGHRLPSSLIEMSQF